MSRYAPLVVQAIIIGGILGRILYEWAVGQRRFKAERRAWRDRLIMRERIILAHSWIYQEGKENTLYACFDGWRYPDNLCYRADRLMGQAKEMRENQIRQAGHVATNFWRTKYL